MTRSRDLPDEMIDRAHLDRQTIGDPRLAAEVLGMFVLQLDKACRDLRGSGASGRTAIAHALKGTARSVGVFAIGDCAAAIEQAPHDDAHLDRLGALAARLRGELERRGPPPG